jgi:quinol monooxygenase YgiN
MFIAHVHFAVASARRAEALDTLVAEAATVRAMPGCLAFLPFADPLDGEAIGILHEWQSADHFAAYTASPGFAEVGATLRPMMLRPPISRRFVVQPADAMV